MAFKMNPFTGSFDYYEPNNGIVSIGRISNLSLVYCEEFVGDGADTTFTITGAVTNAIYSTGAWDLKSVAATLAIDITDLDDGAIYDSNNIFTKTRISVNGMNPLTGVVTLSLPPMLLAGFKVWYWYTLKPKDVLSFYYRPEYVSKMEADASSGVAVAANNISANTTSFNTILSASDDNVQKALDTIDKHTHPETPVYNYMPGGWY
jgi:hypothetical protein